MEKKENTKREKRGSVSSPQVIIITCKSILIFLITLPNFVPPNTKSWIRPCLLYPRMLCANFGWNWPSGSGSRIWKCENVTDRQMDRRNTNKKLTKLSIRELKRGRLHDISIQCHLDLSDKIVQPFLLYMYRCEICGLF